MYYAELNVPKTHVYLFKPQMKIWHEMIDSHPNLTFYGIISARQK